MASEVDTLSPEELRDRVLELEATLDLRWKASMRAVKRWEAATGIVLQHPDHADLVVWLLGELERKDERITDLLRANNAEVERRRDAEHRMSVMVDTSDLLRRAMNTLSSSRRDLVTTLEKCRQRFLEYAESHREKGALEKMKRNVDMATMIEEALAR